MEGWQFKCGRCFAVYPAHLGERRCPHCAGQMTEVETAAKLVPIPGAVQHCPGTLHCPLYVLSHDARNAGLGCVRDLAMPCLGERPENFHKLYMKAQRAIVTNMERAMIPLKHEGPKL